MPSWPFALLAGAGCALLGLAWAGALSSRRAALDAWARTLMRLEASLAYRPPALADWLLLGVRGETDASVCGVLETAAQRMRQDALLTLSRAAPQPRDLTATDRAALSPLWTGLGAGDEAAQRALLEAVRASLDAQRTQARQAEARDHRLAVSLGVLGALAVFLFLL